MSTLPTARPVPSQPASRRATAPAPGPVVPSPATVPTPAGSYHSQRTSVLVVAHDHRVRAALAAVVAASEQLDLAGQVASGLAARDLLAHATRRHAVVVDIDVPVPAGPLALVSDLSTDHDVIALAAGRTLAVSAASAGAVAVASTLEEVEDAISRTAAPSDDTAPPAEGDAADGAARAGQPMSPADLVAVLVAVFLPPWAFWFSAIANDAGLIGWRLPQGAALWSMVLPLVGVVGWRFGGSGLRDLAARVTRWRVPVRSYAAALSVPVAVAATAVGMAMALGAPNPTGRVLAAGPAAAYFVTGTALFLLTEELAWRGVLLPRLLTRTTPWAASLVVGAVWAAWHLPLLHVAGAGDAGLPVAGFALLVVATSVLMTAVVGLGRGSVLVAALAHAALDASYSWFGVVGPDHRVFWCTVVVTTVAAVALVLATGGRLCTPTRATVTPRPHAPARSLGTPTAVARIAR